MKLLMFNIKIKSILTLNYNEKVFTFIDARLLLLQKILN